MPYHSILKLPNPPPQRARALVFADPRSLALLQRLRQIAPSSAAVLVTGETGTGKEIVARELHAASLRRDRPFVAVNCGALTPSLVESELFGHDRGAFTGAAGAQPGWFEAADGGTLFLDEIGELPLNLQVKLLRVLQERQVVRLGSRRPLPFDVRLIAATNVDLEAAVAAGRFRADLFYRLNVARLDLPPLRERRGDILPAVAHFLEVHRDRDRAPPLLTDEAAARLQGYDWPGNLRQVENIVQQALLLTGGDRLDVADLQLPALPRPASIAPGERDPGDRAPGSRGGAADFGGAGAVAATCSPAIGDGNTGAFAACLAAEEAGHGAAGSVAPGRAAAAASPANGDDGDSLDRVLLRLLESGLPDLHRRIEERLFRTAYRYAERNQLQTARLLGISRNIVRARLLELGEISSATRRPPPPSPDPPSTDRQAP